MNLIEALGGIEAEHAVCTTFPFEPLFFSNYAIDSLQEAGVATPVVLMDDQQYEQLARQRQLTSRAIGRHFYLEPVTVKGTFHPKVTFLAGESACHVSVTSANLTLGEYTTAAQLGQTVSVTAESSDVDTKAASRDLTILKDVREFVDQLAQEYVSGQDPHTEIKRAVQATEWIEEKSPSQSTTSGFFHNLETPILEQISNQIEDITTATLFAPFFGNEKTLSKIDESIDADNYEILVAEGNTHLDPESAMQAFDGTVTFRSLSHSTARWIHAKGIIFEGSWGTATLYGSPNITGQALLETAATGNLEAGFLNYAPDEHSRSPLWDQTAFSVNPGASRDPAEFEFADYTIASHSESNPNHTLSDARVEQVEEDEIVVRFVAPAVKDGTTVTIESLEETTIDVLWDVNKENEKEGVSVRLNESWAKSIVRLNTTDAGQSNYRQITTEPTAGTRKVGEVLRNDGREAVQSLVDETLFLGVGVAPGVISEAVSRLSEKYEQQDAQLEEQVQEVSGSDEENQKKRFSSGINGVSKTERKPHLGVKDGMDYAEDRIESILENPPTVESVTELIDHFENLWYYITRGLIRSSLAPQLEAEGEQDEFETSLNVDRLHSICTKCISKIFESRWFIRIRNYVNTIHAMEPESTADAFADNQLLDVFVVYPAIVLALMDWHDEAFVERFNYLRQYQRTMSFASPILGELLIDGTQTVDRLNEHTKTLEDQLSEFSERIDREISLPGEFMPGLEILFYGFWYRELAKDRDQHLFDNTVIFDRYPSKDLAEMARIALRGQDRVAGDPSYADLQKGKYDSIIRLTKGLNDPNPQLHSIIEHE